VADPRQRIVGVSVTLFSVVFLVRALQTACVIVDPSGVTTRALYRARRYSFSELAYVEVVLGPIGFVGYKREYLLLHRRDGQHVAFKELNSPRSNGEAMSAVRRAAGSINGRLAQA